MTPSSVARSVAAATLCAGAVVGCADAPDDTAGAGDPDATTAQPPAPTEPTPTFDETLRDELVSMLRADQANGGSDAARVERLQEIIAVYGWPTYDLVGRRGEDAAWLIAQHADLQPAFQERALGLLRRAVEDGQASPGNLAYLEDRVAVANGQPQTYGTQIRCTRSGPRPTTPIKDRAGVDDRRAAAGLEPLAAYVREMTQICST